MARSALTGTRIRERRTLLGIKQADLARMAEISPSYLNLIEHNRRRIGGKLLTRIARSLSVEVSVLTQGAEANLIDQLGEAAAAHPEVEAEVQRIDEFVGRFPGWAGLIREQQRRVVQLEQRVAALIDRLSHDPFLSASLHEILTRVSAIQSTSSILIETEDLDQVWTDRFHRNLDADSRKLAEGAAALVQYLDAESDGEIGLMSPQEELEAWLNRRSFHVPELETDVPELIDRLVEADGLIATAAGRDLARAYLHRYRADVLAMPLEAFAEAAVALDYDPASLALRFGCNLPAVFRRLAALPSDSGVARIGFVLCDGSGALTLRKSTDLLAMPRFGAACALWPLYRALIQPMAPIRAVIENASRPGLRFVAYAISHASYPQGFAGPAVHQAMMVLVPPERLAPPKDLGTVLQVGTSCRVCPLRDCPARREPSILADSFDSGATSPQ